MTKQNQTLGDSISRTTLFLVLLFVPMTSFAQIPDSDDYPPGLLATYRQGDQILRRVDSTVAFDWSDQAVEPTLQPGPVQAAWTGNLLLRKSGRYTFHAYVHGAVKIHIDDQTVLDDSSTNKAQWVSGRATDLSFGERTLNVEFQSPANQSGSIALFWSSAAFPLEPLPELLLFRDEAQPELSKREFAHDQLIQHRCANCHRDDYHTPLTKPSPDLTRLRGAIARSWLVRKIAGTLPHQAMPQFDISNDEAQDIAAWLLTRGEQPKLDRPKAPKGKGNEKDDIEQGTELLHSVGCLACHKIGTLGEDSTFTGPNLSEIGGKRSTDWFYTWLETPAELNRDHSMPVFSLSKNERRQLAIALASMGQPSSAEEFQHKKAKADQVERGRKLAEKFRCANCHRVPGLQPSVADIPALVARKVDWSNSCVNQPKRKTAKRQPHYTLDKNITAALQSYVDEFGKLRSGPSKPSPHMQGAFALRQKGCVNCHERLRDQGIVATAGRVEKSLPKFRGLSQALIPPSLTAVGDKLKDDALARAISGRQDARLPWLKVRMPRFEHSKVDAAALVEYFKAHDRIPDGRPASSSREATSEVVSRDEALLLGHTLCGPRGLSCMACHVIGDYEPAKVALGTRGSNLMALGKRMRRDYFLRWTRSPIRIVPGMEMPSMNRAVPGILKDDISTQLNVLWDALNDEQFVPPTNPSVVEQFFEVRAGDRPRIVRDVFTNAKENGGGYIARSFAAGFGNGHNVLFDLDAFSVRGWYFGDLARQRTEGKSWYWDMAGLPVMTNFTGSDFALRKRGNKKIVRPKFEHGTTGWLHDYHVTEDTVQIHYHMNFEIDGAVREVEMAEGWTPNSNGGWRRMIGAELPPGYELLVLKPSVESRFGSRANIVPERRWETIADNENSFQAMVLARRSDPAAVRGNMPTMLGQLTYSADIQRPPGALKATQPIPNAEGRLTSIPGCTGDRLHLPTSIMPTSMTFTSNGTLAFTSLKGNVWLAHDSNGDGIEDRLQLFEEGLAAPFGILADGNDIIVAHKPEVIRLIDSDNDGRADKREVLATGWGYTDNYHDWTTGLVRDSKNQLYVGLGSDYAQKNRPRDKARWRGSVLRIAAGKRPEPVGWSFRYPVGLGINARDQVFVTDNQGVQNTFNEINLLQPGRHYGVPSRYEPNAKAAETRASIQVPHPWSRSVNAIFFLNDAKSGAPFVNHAIGCEYDSRFLARFTFQTVGDSVQGATYYFSKPDQPNGGSNFVGPICGAVAPNGEIYIGSIYDSGWQGGRNTGAIEKLRPTGKPPIGIRELRALPNGFELEFTAEVDRKRAADLANYSISGYTRVWKGGYGTPDSERHRVEIRRADVSDDGRRVRLIVNQLREKFVYEVSTKNLLANGRALWPATGHYTMNRVPKSSRQK